MNLANLPNCQTFKYSRMKYILPNLPNFPVQLGKLGNFQNLPAQFEFGKKLKCLICLLCIRWKQWDVNRMVLSELQ